MENAIMDAPAELKTCKVTLVSPGYSDAVIKIYPAEHAAERIDLNRRPGIERWDAVKRFMNQFAPRGEAIPAPIQYHPSTENLKTTDVTEDKIPLVRLENAVLKPPKVDKIKPQPTPATQIEIVNKRIEGIENTVNTLASTIQTLAETVQKFPARAPAVRRGRRKKAGKKKSTQGDASNDESS